MKLFRDEDFKQKQIPLTISELWVDFEKIGSGCLSNNFNMSDIHNLYVEITISGCKYLCKYLHNDTCTLVMFLPNSRSCVLLPLQEIPIVDEHAGCKKVEIHRKHKKTGNDVITNQRSQLALFALPTLHRIYGFLCIYLHIWAFAFGNQCY